MAINHNGKIKHPSTLYTWKYLWGENCCALLSANQLPSPLLNFFFYSGKQYANLLNLNLRHSSFHLLQWKCQRLLPPHCWGRWWGWHRLPTLGLQWAHPQVRLQHTGTGREILLTRLGSQAVPLRPDVSLHNSFPLPSLSLFLYFLNNLGAWDTSRQSLVSGGIQSYTDWQTEMVLLWWVGRTRTTSLLSQKSWLFCTKE